MIDADHSLTARGPVTITQSRTSWGIESGHHRLAVTRMREARSIGKAETPRGRPTTSRSIWPIAIGTFASVSAFGLVVFGAVASEPLSFAGHQRYSLIVPLPARNIKPATDRSARIPKPRAATPVVPLADDADLAEPHSIRGPALADEVYVSRAMRTGDFQEWLGADGQRRFLSAGPEQVDGAQRCRALALLIRRTDGSNEVRNSRHCTGALAGGRQVTSDGEGSEEEVTLRAAPAALVPSEEEPAVAGQDAAITSR